MASTFCENKRSPVHDDKHDTNAINMCHVRVDITVHLKVYVTVDMALQITVDDMVCDGHSEKVQCNLITVL